MKHNYLLLITLFTLFSFNLKSQEIADFNGNWNYEYSEVKLNGEWKIKKKSFDFNYFEPKEIFELEQEEEDILQLETATPEIPLLILDTKFQYFFGSIFANLGKLNLFVKKGKNSLTDYSNGYVRFELLKEENETMLRIFNDEKEEFYVLLNITNTEMILKNLSNNNKIHFKRI